MFPRKKHINKFRYLIFPMLILLFVFLFLKKDGLSETGIFKEISKINILLARPFINLQNKFINFKNSASFYFVSKKKLNNLVNSLKEENLKLKADTFKLEILEKQNKDFLSILGRKTANDFIAASLIFRPSFSGFDYFLIDAGERDFVKKGMKVTAYDSILLGEVYEVFEKESKVKLYSASENKIGVFLENAGTYAEALGRGSENFEIILAKDMNIAEGDKVLVQGMENFILGEVSKIVENRNEPFKKAYFRYPFNLSELKYVEILIR